MLLIPMFTYLVFNSKFDAEPRVYTCVYAIVYLEVCIQVYGTNAGSERLGWEVLFTRQETHGHLVLPSTREELEKLNKNFILPCLDSNPGRHKTVGHYATASASIYVYLDKFYYIRVTK